MEGRQWFPADFSSSCGKMLRNVSHFTISTSWFHCFTSTGGFYQLQHNGKKKACDLKHLILLHSNFIVKILLMVSRHGEWYRWHNTPGCPATGLHNFGCLPGTLLQKHTCPVWTGTGHVPGQPGALCPWQGFHFPCYRSMNRKNVFIGSTRCWQNLLYLLYPFSFQMEILHPLTLTGMRKFYFQTQNKLLFFFFCSVMFKIYLKFCIFEDKIKFCLKAKICHLKTTAPDM